MAYCNIKRYDELPSRIGFVDVDALRAGLNYDLDKLKKFTKRVIEKKNKLEEARIKWEKIQMKKSKSNQNSHS